jgi:spore maturation protein CgeB
MTSMRIVLFYHSLVSDWNHGNAHFLRGIVSELIGGGHDVRVFEPKDGWSRRHLLEDAGPAAIRGFRRAYPTLVSTEYVEDELDLDGVLDGADLVIVHEWNSRALVQRIGRHRRDGGHYVLLFHDTHHRSATAPEEMAAYDLEDYDGVLAFGEVIRQRYLDQGWHRRAFTWHEAADTTLFRPQPQPAAQRDLAWIGNWGDNERTAELGEFLLEPIAALELTATAYGVRYPERARRALLDRGIVYGGWLPNYEVPQVFARHRLTVHVPRRPYVRALPGIPTIRPFEALACGIPLICAPWRDEENLFTPGEDYLVARNGIEMVARIRELLADPARAEALSRHGLETIRRRHTCAHRVEELLRIHDSIAVGNRRTVRIDGEEVRA